MLNTIKRIGIILYQKYLNIDDLSAKYPVCVKGILIENNRVLMLKNEKFEFDLPGGKLDAHQNIEEALIKEFKEETQLDIKIIKLIEIEKYFLNNRFIVMITYLVENKNINPISISFENWGFQFIPLNEIHRHPLKKWIYQLIKSTFDT